MKFFNKLSAPELDMDAANTILEQVFEAADTDPNTIPLDVLAANGLYRRKRHILQNILFVGAIVLVLLLAFLYVLSIPSSFTVQNQMAEDEFNPVYTIDVDSFMLVNQVNVTIDGHNLPIYEEDSHVYTVEPSLNGQMEVTVTLLNGKSTTQYVDVTNVDKENPVALGCEREGSLIYLYLSDELSGIDYDSIRTATLTGEAVTPASVDPAAGCVTFSHLEETVNVYVSDFAGNELQLILSIS